MATIERAVPTRVPVGVGVIVVCNDQILIGKRKGKSGHGEWALPGGWLEVGESFEACAVRELEEETGITASSFVSVPSCAPIPPCNNIFTEGSVKHSVSIFVRIHVTNGTVAKITEPDKCFEWLWVPMIEPETWPQPLFISLGHVSSLPAGVLQLALELAQQDPKNDSSND